MHDRAEESRDAGVHSDTIPKLTVGQLLEDPQLSVSLKRVAGEAGLDRPLRHPRVQKNGLALAGHHEGVVPTRVQLLGDNPDSSTDSRTFGPLPTREIRWLVLAPTR